MRPVNKKNKKQDNSEEKLARRQNSIFLENK